MTNTATNKQQTNIKLLPTQHNFNTQIHYKYIKVAKQVNINRLLIIGLIILDIILFTIVLQPNDDKLNNQIMFEEGIPTHLEQVSFN